jgi:hypothetical protein
MLLVSYTGSKDGRIIQAHYDGSKLHLQFSPLFQMVDEKTAPIDLFLRYTVGTPVGKLFGWTHLVEQWFTIHDEPDFA